MQKVLRHIVPTVALSAGLFLAAPVSAGPASSPTEMQVCKHKSETPEQARKRANKSRQVRGTVIQSKQVKIKGSDLTNKVMLLRTQKGNKLLVIDAGRTDKLANLELDKGKQVSARGQVVTMKGQQVLIASDLKQGNQRVSVDRSQQLDQLARSAHASQDASKKPNQQK